ncbi:MAG: hypothetical protein KDI39_10155 [Pseudomonadales bacterium]|nr:hypothetical protein [Pseudomonadales bacterium]
MSYYNLIDLYLIDNAAFNNAISNFGEYIKKKEDICFFSYYKDWLTDRFLDILKRSNTKYKSLQFLSYYPYPFDEEGMYFIVEPKEMAEFSFQLDYLMDWVIQDDYCTNHYKSEMHMMINNVSFENYDIWDMYESWSYPYYCLSALRSMMFYASENDKFIVVHVLSGG